MRECILHINEIPSIVVFRKWSGRGSMESKMLIEALLRVV